MITSIDQNQDYSSRELYSYLSGVRLPEFVKQASISEVVGFEKTAYADGSKYFPIAKKVDTFISAVFFLNKHADLKKAKGEKYVQKVAAAIDAAADIFEIKQDISNYGIQMIQKKAAEESKEQTIIFKIAQDEFDLFTIKVASDVSIKAAEFVAGLDRYPFEWRKAISEQFVKAAEAYDIDELPDLILKYAGQYFPSSEDVKLELARRKTKLSAENAQRYEDLISDVDNIETRDEFFKLAEVCYFIEKNAGLYDKPQYRKILGDPVDKFFTLHFEKVAELMDVVKVGNARYTINELQKVSSDIYEKAFGFEKPASADELRDILPTMPLSDFNLFKQLSGISAI